MILNMPSSCGRDILEPTAVVVHAAAEYIRLHDGDIHIVDFLRSRGESAHAFITPHGHIIRTRGNQQIAWHARAQGFNFKSLGIEFLVSGAHTIESFRKTIQGDWLTGLQYLAGVNLVKTWITLGKITEVVRHCDIDPELKKDPGAGFPWINFQNDIGWKNATISI